MLLAQTSDKTRTCESDLHAKWKVLKSWFAQLCERLPGKLFEIFTMSTNVTKFSTKASEKKPQTKQDHAYVSRMFPLYFSPRNPGTAVTLAVPSGLK